jgi:ADP-ribose pyrophosphatase YjhB (NUDIX family)
MQTFNRSSLIRAGWCRRTGCAQGTFPNTGAPEDPEPAACDPRMPLRERVVVYVERHDALLVFDHRDDPEAGTQVPAGGVQAGEGLATAAIREVREETGVDLEAEPTLLGSHEHLDGRGQPAIGHFFRVGGPDGLPDAWEHVVPGGGADAGLVFECRFELAPELWPVQALLWSVRGHSSTLAQAVSLTPRDPDRRGVRHSRAPRDARIRRSGPRLPSIVPIACVRLRRRGRSHAGAVRLDRSRPRLRKQDMAEMQFVRRSLPQAPPFLLAQ